MSRSTRRLRWSLLWLGLGAGGLAGAALVAHAQTFSSVQFAAPGSVEAPQRKPAVQFTPPKGEPSSAASAPANPAFIRSATFDAPRGRGSAPSAPGPKFIRSVTFAAPQGDPQAGPPESVAPAPRPNGLGTPQADSAKQPFTRAAQFTVPKTVPSLPAPLPKGDHLGPQVAPAPLPPIPLLEKPLAPVPPASVNPPASLQFKDASPPAALEFKDVPPAPAEPPATLQFRELPAESSEEVLVLPGLVAPTREDIEIAPAPRRPLLNLIWLLRRWLVFWRP